MIFDKWVQAWNNADVETMRSFMCDDAEMIMHSDNSKISADEWRDRMSSMIGKLKQENLRCIYENDDILVTHFIMTFPNGTRDAVMYVATKRDGKILRIETGSTPLPT